MSTKTGANEGGPSASPTREESGDRGVPGRPMASRAKAALEHLQRMTRGQEGGPEGVRPSRRAVSSSLGVDETYLLEGIDLVPCGVVTGACAWRSPLLASYLEADSSGEPVGLSATLRGCVRGALSQVLEQAGSLGADGVASLELELRSSAVRREVEVTLIGTALVRREVRPRAQHPDYADTVAEAVGRNEDAYYQPPGLFSASLPAKDLYLLERHGHQALGIVVGVCAYRTGRHRLQARARRLPPSVEIGQLGALPQGASERAMARLEDEARRVGASGVVGVRLRRMAVLPGDRASAAIAVGTAVRAGSSLDADLASCTDGSATEEATEEGAVPAGAGAHVVVAGQLDHAPHISLGMRLD